MTIRIVQSKQNPRVKELRSAVQRPGRGESDLIALEGINLVTEALRSGLRMQTIFLAQGHENLLDALNVNPEEEILALPYELLAESVSTESPQPIAALAHPRNWPWAEILTPNALVVVLAGIQDPGNLGTILRSAEAFGATGAICLSGTVNRWNPKVLRASAGSVFRLPTLSSSESKCFEHLHAAGIRTLATSSHEASPVSQQDLTGPVALLIGAEGSGLSPELTARCDASIAIPCPGPVESLNAAVAASILLYEASRQRTSRSSPPS